MPNYSYVAQKPDGQIVKGTYSAKDQNEVYNNLREQGYFPHEINEQGKVLSLSSLNTTKKAKKLKLKDLSVFCKQFSAILKAGIPVLKCLDLLKRQATDKNVELVLNGLYEDVQRGIPLSDAMKGQKNVFPQILISMIEAGEATGSLEYSFDRMSIHFEKEIKINQKLSKALIYPIMMVVVCILAVIVLLVAVVPKFATMFEEAGMKLPFSTQILIGAEKFLMNFWWLVGILTVGAVIGFMKFKDTQQGKRMIHSLYFKIPVIADLIQKTSAEKFTRTTATMLSAGVSLVNALDMVQRVIENTIVKEAVGKIKEDVIKGKGLSDAVSRFRFFPVMVPQMIEVGEESGSLDKMLENTANFYENEVDNQITVVTTLIEPAILVVLAVVVGFIVMSIVQPMFGMINTVS